MTINTNANVFCEAGRLEGIYACPFKTKEDVQDCADLLDVLRGISRRKPRREAFIAFGGKAAACDGFAACVDDVWGYFYGCPYSQARAFKVEGGTFFVSPERLYYVAHGTKSAYSWPLE